MSEPTKEFKQAKEWFKKQSEVDREAMALLAIERLMELEELAFREYDYCTETGATTECIHWVDCGEPLSVPF